MSSERSHERGQATVELVLLLPIVMLALLAVIQVGLVVHDRLLVAHAAREAARAAAVEPTPASARTGAVTTSGLDPARMTVTLSGGTATGDRLTATVRYRAATQVPLVGHLVGDVGLESAVTMRVE